MNIKAVVKVMNFHALLRVDASNKKAQLYQTMENELESMMRIVTNNRNLRLDKRLGAPDPSKPKLRIYFGSDYGFCGSVNSSVSRVMAEDRTGEKIIIGKKIRHQVETRLFMNFEDFEKDFETVRAYLVQAVKERSWSSVEIVYNHFYNLTAIRQEVKQIYPLTPKEDDTDLDTGDFEIEDEDGTLLEDMLLSYLCYEVKIAAASSYASENTMRQNSTTESLRKIDEMAAEEKRLERKEHTQKAFKKTIDSYINQKAIKA